MRLEGKGGLTSKTSRLPKLRGGGGGNLSSAGALQKVDLDGELFQQALCCKHEYVRINSNAFASEIPTRQLALRSRSLLSYLVLFILRVFSLDSCNRFNYNYAGSLKTRGDTVQHKP